MVQILKLNALNLNFLNINFNWKFRLCIIKYIHLFNVYFLLLYIYITSIMNILLISNLLLMSLIIKKNKGKKWWFKNIH